MPRIHRLYLGVAVATSSLTLIGVVVTPQVYGDTPQTSANGSYAARGGCTTDHIKYRLLGPRHPAWIATNESSHWTEGPATISFTRTRTATAGSSHSSSTTVGGGISYGIVSAKIDKTWGKETSRSVSKSSSWRYDIRVPRNVVARGVVRKRGISAKVRKVVVYNRPCPRTQDVYKFWAHVPYSRTRSIDYCVVGDKKPATRIHRQCGNEW